MQDKLLINYIARGQTIEIPIERARFKDCLFSFNEYEDVSIKYVGENYTIKLECISALENEVFHYYEDNTLTLKSNVVYKISVNESKNEEVSYRPGDYKITIANSNTTFESGFTVLCNNQLSKDGMDSIVSLINDFITGLTIDFFKDGKGAYVSNDAYGSKYVIYDIIARHKSRIITSTDKLYNELNQSISTSIVEGSIQKRQNYKTLLLNSKRLNNTYYSVKKVLKSDDPSNILLKRYLVKIFSIISQCRIGVKNEIEDKKNERDSMDQVLKSLYTKHKNQSYSAFDRQNFYNEANNLKGELKELDSWLLKLKSWNEAYSLVYYSIKRLLDSESLRNLNENNYVGYTNTFYTNYSYKFIFDLYNSLIAGNTTSATNKIYFTNKKSFTIFEMFGFIVLQSILEELGFTLDSRAEEIFDFKPDSTFTFTKNQYRIKIQYDHFCKRYIEGEADSIVNINSTNCKPDYILTIYENGRAKSVVICEMKYRNIKKLVTGMTNELDHTLDNYYQLAYLKELNSRPVHLVDNVVVIYPSLDEVILDRHFTNYLGFNLTIPLKESKSYNVLHSIISNNIFK